MICFLLIYIVLKRKEYDCPVVLPKGLSFFVIALFPCFWCFLIAGHVFHGWTCWLYSISVFAILQMTYDLSKFHNVGKD